ncbi:class I SAM-dependent methyltransferase [Rhodopirellula halodulae]|uniref:class I SAM-dependent methyltransferase n=1 Tax=Rhodopirellula halodulae TaxID=2894198 RepID=UPI001E63A461|nr:class I SAM-dependent methyltransferase [Rhodopirellula sp. JC737]MCC9656908.1 class I SAM-dependent methyltransferase [Rhodopirellula sp. JC737]
MLERVQSIISAIQFNLKVQSLPDRVYLREVMLPAMAAADAADVLLVGTRRYTRRYPNQFHLSRTQVWTMDVEPSVARFGNGQWHRTGDICRVNQVFENQRFDLIHLNGVLGFGVNDSEQIQGMVDACHEALRPNGYVMIGWDADRTEDPTHDPGIASRFEHADYMGLPARHRVTGMDGHDHVFDWFRRLD